jgi:predicted metal-dependent RNase
MNEFSAHADKNELMDWTSGFRKRPHLTCVVHGSEEAARAHQTNLLGMGLERVIVPERGDTVEA